MESQGFFRSQQESGLDSHALETEMKTMRTDEEIAWEESASQAVSSGPEEE